MIGRAPLRSWRNAGGKHDRRPTRGPDRDPLIIFAGVSVTRTLPYGTPADVRSELRRLVENGPPTGLFLGASSSITPGVPWANLHALIDGLAHYRALT